MLKKHVNLLIFSENLPLYIKIYSQNGVLLSKKNMDSNYLKINLCTSFCKLYIIARYDNITQKKVVCLTNDMCQNSFVGFKFFKQVILPSSVTQKFLLYDANYNLPIDATLSFVEQ